WAAHLHGDLLSREHRHAAVDAAFAWRLAPAPSARQRRAAHQSSRARDGTGNPTATWRAIRVGRSGILTAAGVAGVDGGTVVASTDNHHSGVGPGYTSVVIARLWLDRSGRSAT